MTTQPPPEESPRPARERWGEILAYPLQAGALSTNVALAVSHLVAHLPLGFILDLLVWAAFFKYAFEVLRWSANGRTQAPEISLSVSDAVARYAMLLLVLAEVALSLLPLTYSSGYAIAFALVLTFAMPAIVMVLAIDEDFFRAVNPFAWAALAIRLRGSYLAMVGFFAAALFVQSVVAAALQGVLPALVVTVAVFCVVNYLMIAVFHLIGWIIHEHADELGYTGHIEFHAPPPDAGPDERIVDSARRRAAEGDVEGAVALLRDEIAVRPDALALHEEYRHWLGEAQAPVADRLAQARQHIRALLAHDQEHAALEVARESFALDAGFALDEAEDVTRLGAVAAAAGQSQLALSLLAGFHKRFRNHPDIARNYLLAAKIMAERMNREMQARALLQQIRIVLPHDPLIPEVEAYLAFLDRLGATPSRTTPPAG